MRIQTRILTCILALGMILPICVQADVAPVAAVPELVQVNVNHEEAAKKLLAFGIVAEEDTTPQSKAVSRGEFVQKLCKLFKYGEVGIESKGVFKDITPSAPYAASVKAAYEAGLINRADNGLFYPEREITLNEAVKMTITALGYDVYAREMGYPTGYMVQAKALNLLSNVVCKSDEILTKGDTCMLLSNAAEVEYLKLVSAGEANRYEKTENKTLLTDVYHIYKAKGQISATGISSLSAVGSKIRRGYVQIGGDTFAVGETDAELYLGYTVELYYSQETGENEKTALYVSLRSNRNDTVEISSKDIADTTTAKEIVYYDENENLKKTDIPTSADLIYNGTAHVLNSDFLLKPESGKVVLLDSDMNGDYDVVFVTSYITYVVNQVNKDTLSVIDMYGQSALDLDTTDSSKSIVIKLDGKKTDTSSLSKWNVLSVAANLETIDQNGLRRVDENATCYFIEGSTTSVFGTVSERSDEEIVINGQKYQISGYYTYLKNTSKIADCKMGELYAFYFNSENELVTIDSDGLESSGYGYLINVHAQGGVKNELLLKVLESTGEISVLSCAKSLRVDGVSGVAPYNPNASVGDLYSRITSGGKVLNQIIGYNKNSQGKIITVDTQAEDLGGNDSSSLKNYGHYTDIGYKSSDQAIGEKFVIDASVVIFNVPEVKNQNNEDLWLIDKNFTIGNRNQFKNDEKPVFDAYNVDRAKVVKMMVVYGSGGSALDADNYIAVIEKVTSVINDDGETVKKLYIMENGKKQSYYITEDGFTLNKYNETTTQKIYNNLYAGTNEEVLSSGDIIRLATNSYREITDVELVVDLSKDALTYQKSKNHGVASRIIYGLVYDVYHNFAEVVFDENQLDLPAETRDSAVYALKSVPIMVYNVKNETVKIGTVQDIATYKDYRNTNNTTRIAINARYGEIRSIVIYSDMME